MGESKLEVMEGMVFDHDVDPTDPMEIIDSLWSQTTEIASQTQHSPMAFFFDEKRVTLLGLGNYFRLEYKDGKDAAAWLIRNLVSTGAFSAVALIHEAWMVVSAPQDRSSSELAISLATSHLLREHPAAVDTLLITVETDAGDGLRRTASIKTNEDGSREILEHVDMEFTPEEDGARFQNFFRR